MNMTDKTPAEMLRSWAQAYRTGPKELRFPSDPEAEFFPVDMEVAANEIDRLWEALEKISDGYGPDHGSKFCANISTAALAARLDKRG